MTMISTTPQRLYFMQLSVTTLPVAADRALGMVCVCYLVKTSDGQHILFDSELAADAPLTPGTPKAQIKKKCSSSWSIWVSYLPISIS